MGPGSCQDLFFHNSSTIGRIIAIIVAPEGADAGQSKVILGIFKEDLLFPIIGVANFAVFKDLPADLPVIRICVICTLGSKPFYRFCCFNRNGFDQFLRLRFFPGHTDNDQTDQQKDTGNTVSTPGKDIHGFGNFAAFSALNAAIGIKAAGPQNCKAQQRRAQQNQQDRRKNTFFTAAAASGQAQSHE